VPHLLGGVAASSGRKKRGKKCSYRHCPIFSGKSRFALATSPKRDSLSLVYARNLHSFEPEGDENCASRPEEEGRVAEGRRKTEKGRKYLHTFGTVGGGKFRRRPLTTGGGRRGEEDCVGSQSSFLPLAGRVLMAPAANANSNDFLPAALWRGRRSGERGLIKSADRA